MKRASKHGKSLFSKKKQKRKNAGGHSTPNKKQGAGFWVATCSIHGIKRAKPNEQALWVMVPAPRGKKQRQSGCPICRKSKLQQAARAI